MTWLIWRQHRAQAAIAAVLLAAFAVPVWLTGSSLAGRLTACRAGTTCGAVFDGYRAIDTVVDLTVIVPLLLGAFCGASLLAREFESGTAALAWTQSVTRRRWLAGKLAALFGITGACAAVDAALVTWWSNTHNALVDSRLSGLQFDIQGVTPVAYTIFAVALGLCAGALWRRTLPAMATTVAGYVGARLIVELSARPHFLRPLVRTAGFTKDDPTPSGALSLGTSLIHHGRVVTGPIQAPAACGSVATRHSLDACMSRLGYAIRVSYQPAGRYWHLQWIEAGIFLALAAVLATAAAAVILRRDA